MNVAKFYPLALEVAQLSKDPRTKVGAVVIDARGAVRAVGYNGFPRGVEDDPGRYAHRETKLLLVAHAEANAIANAAAVGTPLEGCGLVVTKYPCQASKAPPTPTGAIGGSSARGDTTSRPSPRSALKR